MSPLSHCCGVHVGAKYSRESHCHVTSRACLEDQHLDGGIVCAYMYMYMCVYVSYGYMCKYAVHICLIMAT